MNEGASGKPSAIKRLLAPLSILALSATIFFILVKNEPTLRTIVKEPIPVAVRALDISLTPMQLSVSSEGNVQPSVETKLVAQVAGETSEGAAEGADALAAVAPHPVPLAGAHVESSTRPVAGATIRAFRTYDKRSAHEEIDDNCLSQGRARSPWLPHFREWLRRTNNGANKPAWHR